MSPIVPPAGVQPLQDIKDVPQSFYKTKSEIQEKNKAQEQKEFEKLVRDRAEQAISYTADKEIKKPSMFLKTLKNIMSSLGAQGGPLLDKLNIFFNDFYAQARRGPVVVPGVIQKALIQEAASIDKSGVLLANLKNAFDERYGEVYEREQQMKEFLSTRPRRYAFKVAAILRKISEELTNKALVNAVKKYVENLLKDNNLNPEQLGAYRVVPKKDMIFNEILPEDNFLSVRLQYDGSMRQDDMLNIIGDRKFKYEGKEVEILPEKMPDSAAWGYLGKNADSSYHRWGKSLSDTTFAPRQPIRLKFFIEGR